MENLNAPYELGWRPKYKQTKKKDESSLDPGSNLQINADIKGTN